MALQAGRSVRRGFGLGLVAAATLLATGCALEHASTVPNLPATQRQVGDYIDSGRYAADCAKVARSAEAWMEKRAPAAPRPAIVLDIDETSLSNWAAYRVNGWSRILNGGCDLERGPCNIREWQAMARAPAIPSTLELAHRAKALGVAVFFITGRPAEQRDATERNLREQGYSWDGLMLMPAGAHFASAADFKSAERKKLTELGYTILLTMGDQQSDLDGGYAERTFKLPNPAYFLP